MRRFFSHFLIFNFSFLILFVVYPQSPPAPSNRAELVMKALAAAYPDRVGPAVYRNGDWAVFLAGKWFYYADGKLLPENLLAQASQYSGQPFYNYAAELPPWKDPTAEESDRMRQMTERRKQQSGSSVKRTTQFYDDLLRVHNSSESWDRVKSIKFLGFTVMVHYSILTQLSLVEEAILAASKTSASVRQWIGSISSVDG
ncbi:MAG: hypothetical protein FWD78_01080 [Treponema sp.]|nr:hypothetical protein [Treponema sp.]